MVKNKSRRIECPKCGSKHMTKYGKVWVRGARRQRYQCQDCGKHYLEGANRRVSWWLG